MLLVKNFLIGSFVVVTHLLQPIHNELGQVKHHSAQQTNHLVHIEGLVTVDGQAKPALIEVYSIHKNHASVQKLSAEVKTGIFKVDLKIGDEYEINVKVDQLPQQVLQFNAMHIQTDKTMNMYADFTSPAYDQKLEILKKEIDLKLKDELKTSSFEKQYGLVKKDKLFYKIQLGAFKFFENFNYTNVVDLPKIIRKTDSDYITRFTIGNYQSYTEATKVLKLLHQRDLKEAFIIAYYDGERKLLSQLLLEKILP